MNTSQAAPPDSDRCDIEGVDPTRVATTRAELMSIADAERVADLLKLMGERTRVRILYALLSAEEMCVCDLAATVEVSETVVSHSMRLLRGAGAVRRRRDGRKMYYRLDDSHVVALLELSREHLEHLREEPVGP